MGGKSSSDTTTTSSSRPWDGALPTVNALLDHLNPMIQNSAAVTPTESGALDTLSANAAKGNPFSGLINSYATSMLNGGGATDQSGNINANYQRYAAQTNPLASNTNYDPYQTPGFKDAINTMTSDITGNVNGMFAGAGRDLSGMNVQTLARGLTQGIAPTIAAQYNQNIQNQQGAAGNLYNAGNTNAGLLAGLQQQKLANQGTGVTAAQSALDAQNYGPMSQLAIEAQRRGIPTQQLGLLASIGVPLAALGQSSTGTSHTDNTASGVQQFMGITGGLSNLFGGGGGGGGGAGAVAGLAKFFSDKRLKVDIEPVGKLFDGQVVYRYRYIGHDGFQIGLLAQEVETVAPEAVGESHGYKTVDYKLATDNAIKRAA